MPGWVLVGIGLVVGACGGWCLKGAMSRALRWSDVIERAIICDRCRQEMREEMRAEAPPAVSARR